jgi:hypothetical protein
MADLPFPWLPRVLPGDLTWHTGEPSIVDQVKCPPGQVRRPGGRCGPPPPDPGHIVLVPTPPPAPSPPRPGARPPKDEARGPLPPPLEPPPAAPPPRVEPAPPVTRPPVFPNVRGRALPRGVLNPVLGTTGAIAWVLGTLVFGPYFTRSDRDYEEELERTSTRGPPRRRNRPGGTAQADEYPWGRDPYGPYNPLPRFPGTGMPIPLPRRTPNAPARLPRVGIPAPRTLPTRPQPLPRTVPTVRGVPAPAGWTLGDPIEGPGYDPFTRAPPTPSPRTAPRSTPRTRSPVRLPVWLPIGDPVSVPRIGDRPRSTPLTPQQPSSSSPRPRFPPRPTLTPFDEPVPTSEPQGLRKPTESNPCTTERTARRRRQKDCKRYTTKTIRVCADK